MLCTFGFVEDVVVCAQWPNVADANKAYTCTQSDSYQVQHRSIV